MVITILFFLIYHFKIVIVLKLISDDLSFITLGVELVNSGCHNKIPQVGWFKPQESIFIQFWRKKVSAELVSGETPFPALWTTASLP